MASSDSIKTTEIHNNGKTSEENAQGSDYEEFKATTVFLRANNSGSSGDFISIAAMPVVLNASNLYPNIPLI